MVKLIKREKKYTLNSEQIPVMISIQDAQCIELTGRIVLALKETNDKNLGDRLEILFESFRKSGLPSIKSLYDEVSKLLFQNIASGDAIKNEFQMFKDIYLSGRGDFVDSFVVEMESLKKASNENLLSITKNGSWISCRPRSNDCTTFDGRYL